MTEVENHTIRLLQDMREEMRAAFTRLDAKVNDGFETLSDEVAAVKEALVGETVLGRYAAGGVDARLTALERRMSALEKARG